MLVEAQNPLMPAPYDFVWSAVIVLVLGMTITALGQVLRSTAISGAAAIIWVLLILALPVLGAVAWFVLRPRGASGSGAASRAAADAAAGERAASR